MRLLLALGVLVAITLPLAAEAHYRQHLLVQLPPPSFGGAQPLPSSIPVIQKPQREQEYNREDIRYMIDATKMQFLIVL